MKRENQIEKQKGGEMKRIALLGIAVLVLTGMAWAQGKGSVQGSQKPESINTVFKVTSETSSTTAYGGKGSHCDPLGCAPEISCRVGDGPNLVVFESNPATREAGIAYTLPSTGPASLVIYNARGRKVRTLFEGVGKAGKYQLGWDGRNDRGGVIPCGDYFCCLKAAGGLVEVRKVVLDR
jgi:hypothetical protein